MSYQVSERILKYPTSHQEEHTDDEDWLDGSDVHSDLHLQ
jgi:hypothetical protein